MSGGRELFQKKTKVRHLAVSDINNMSHTTIDNSIVESVLNVNYVVKSFACYCFYR